MADKKINDLTLRSNFDGTCNLPADDPTQTYRVTGNQIKEFIRDTSFVAPTMTKLTSTSGLYTTPANVKYLVIEAWGSGGGGCGSGSANGTAPGSPAATTFAIHSSTTLLSVPGGGGGAQGANALGGAGGAAATVTSPAIDLLNLPGTRGGAGPSCQTASVLLVGGKGGDAPIAAGGAGEGNNAGAGNAATGPGGGGGGAGLNGTGSLVWAGSGGGSGAYAKIQINTPAASYDYVIPAGGAGGGAGTGGAAGGAAFRGEIRVWEFYQ